MRHSNMILVLNDDVRCVSVSYQPGEKGYTYKTFDHSLKVDDYVAIPTDTRHGFTIGRVTEVDIDFDIESNLELKWIAGKIDKEAYDTILEKEQEMIRAVGAAERRAKRESMRKNLFEAKEEEMQRIAGIFDASEDALAAPEAPPVP